MPNQNILRWTLVVASFAIISLILWNTYVFFQYFKNEERKKMQNWSEAYTDLTKRLFDTDVEINNVVSNIVTDTLITTPMMLVDSTNKVISTRNIDTLRQTNADTYLDKLKLKFENENEPLEIIVNGKPYSKLYYGNSPLLNKLKYYPLALLLIIFLFGAVVYFFYRSSRNAAQNKLWTGMAKETAHQIGTPLSSLVGWAEILKTENVNPSHIQEIEKDITRLQTITDRFSKIGSVPTLLKSDIVERTKVAYDYLESRSSKLIKFYFEAPEAKIFVNLNEQLYSWTIENLVKNAIDAMKGEGELKVEIINHSTYVNILVSDTGKGISKSAQKKIFEPGYTSKKRGWGLGLSLAKRIIEDYHNGKIKVLDSAPKRGTIMQITLKTIANG